MGTVIHGPWKQRTINSEAVATSEMASKPVDSGPAINYPWHTLTAPPGTTLEEYAETLAHLQRLVLLAGNSGGILSLPIGWSWDPTKTQALIEQLEAIYNGDNSAPPDDIA